MYGSEKVNVDPPREKVPHRGFLKIIYDVIKIKI